MNKKQYIKPQTEVVCQHLTHLLNTSLKHVNVQYKNKDGEDEEDIDKLQYDETQSPQNVWGNAW